MSDQHNFFGVGQKIVDPPVMYEFCRGLPKGSNSMDKQSYCTTCKPCYSCPNTADACITSCQCIVAIRVIICILSTTPFSVCWTEPLGKSMYMYNISITLPSISPIGSYSLGNQSYCTACEPGYPCPNTTYCTSHLVHSDVGMRVVIPVSTTPFSVYGTKPISQRV